MDNTDQGSGSSGHICRVGKFNHVPLLFTIAIYRLTLHPLASLPGPVWGKITDWYSVYHCIQRDRHLNFHRLHLKYGPVVRYGPNRVSVNSASALPTIYGVQANTQKSKWYTVWKSFYKMDMSMSMIDKKQHAVRRRIVTRAIKSLPIKEIERKILRNFAALRIKLVDDESTKGWSPPRNMTTLVAYCFSDIMGETTFSKSWDLQKSEENRSIYHILPQGIAGLSLVGHIPALIKLGILQILRPDLVRDTFRYEALSSKISEWRMSQNDKKMQDFYGSLLKATDPETGRKLSKDELAAESALLIVAGSDTMATAVTCAIFYLLHYPDTLVQLQKEIRSTFQSIDDVVIGPELKSCLYLTACIDESMRLTPGVGAVVQREVLPGGLQVDGQFFPPGTDLAVPHYALHHNENYHSEPHKFIPERWIVGGSRTEDDVAVTKSAYSPYGVGRTSCVGKDLSYQEMGLILARIIWLFDMRLAPGTATGGGNESLGTGRTRCEEFQTWDSFVSIHDGPMVQFRSRK
ncbi:cytochrome P450 [Massarina eburnea CBS 473.64]|uniref:Cytochrome P450 n=1 Tax=Massarina eburnea CBS 473.64 TaxID=1395130 RepID=A0A6A6SEH2_9PLEO|nr:cytochrome P450 [Massarina eburnea CBS 473.64]